MWILVALAGGVGSMARFMLDGAIARVNRTGFPLGTIVINVLGSLLLGLLAGASAQLAGLAAWQTVIGTGVLGGFTTFSTASVEAVNLLRSGASHAVRRAALHSVGMLLVSLGAAALGLFLV